MNEEVKKIVDPKQIISQIQSWVNNRGQRIV